MRVLALLSLLLVGAAVAQANPFKIVPSAIRRSVLSAEEMQELQSTDKDFVTQVTRRVHCVNGWLNANTYNYVWAGTTICSNVAARSSAVASGTTDGNGLTVEIRQGTTAITDGTYSLNAATDGVYLIGICNAGASSIVEFSGASTTVPSGTRTLVLLNFTPVTVQVTDTSGSNIGGQLGDLCDANFDSFSDTLSINNSEAASRVVRVTNAATSAVMFSFQINLINDGAVAILMLGDGSATYPYVAAGRNINTGAAVSTSAAFNVVPSVLLLAALLAVGKFTQNFF